MCCFEAKINVSNFIIKLKQSIIFFFDRFYCYKDKKTYILSEKQVNNIFQEIKIHRYNRFYFLDTYSWAIPNKDTILKLVEFAKGKQILEIGSGLGLWSALLRFYGANIIATDKYIPEKNPYFDREKIYLPYIDIMYMSVREALEKYKTDILFLCWPPYDDSMAEYI